MRWTVTDPTTLFLVLDTYGHLLFDGEVFLIMERKAPDDGITGSAIGHQLLQISLNDLTIISAASFNVLETNSNRPSTYRRYSKANDVFRRRWQGWQVEQVFEIHEVEMSSKKFRIEGEFTT